MVNKNKSQRAVGPLTPISSGGGQEKQNNKVTLYNYTFDKGRLKSLVSWSLKTYGEAKTIRLLENLKKTGFEYATKAGISLGVEDLKIPPKKALLLYEAEEVSNKARIQYERSEITGVERFQRLIDTWHKTSEQLKQEVVDYFEKTDVLNPVYMMAFSGARGNISQVRQLVGMRGLMSDPKGQIIDYPIRSNFREGLTITEYIISSYGARKGIVDTALRTANAGYLTRRLVDVAQHVVIAKYDCGTKKGVFLSDIKEGNKTIFSLQTRLLGRVLGRDIYKPNTTVVDKKHEHSQRAVGPLTPQPENGLSPAKLSESIKIGSRNQEISASLASEIPKYYNKVFVRSALTCETKKLICQLCYGWSLAQGNLVSIGEAVGIVAAQSIGEPGTQLTMRTFHTGGVFSGDISDQIRAPYNGFVQYSSKIAGTLTRTSEGKIVFLTKVDGFISVIKNVSYQKDTSGLDLEIKQETPKEFKIPAYTLLYFKSGDAVFEKQVIAQISTIARQANMRDDASLIVKSPLQGQLVLQDLLVEERLKDPTYKPEKDSETSEFQASLLENHRQLWPKKAMYNPILSEKSLSAWNWGYAWVLSCNQYKLPIFSHNNNVQLIPHAGDFVNTSSVMAKVNWYLPNHGGLKTSIDRAFKSDLPITQQLSSLNNTKNKNTFNQITPNLNTQKAAQAWPIHKLLKSNLWDSGSIYGSTAQLNASKGLNARQGASGPLNYKLISTWLNSKSTNSPNKQNAFIFNQVKIQKNLFNLDVKNIHFNEIGYFLDIAIPQSQRAGDPLTNTNGNTTKSSSVTNKIVFFLPTNLQSKNLNTLNGNSSFRFSNSRQSFLAEDLFEKQTDRRPVKEPQQSWGTTKQGHSANIKAISKQNNQGAGGALALGGAPNFKNPKTSNNSPSNMNTSYDYGIIAFVENSIKGPEAHYPQLKYLNTPAQNPLDGLGQLGPHVKNSPSSNNNQTYLWHAEVNAMTTIVGAQILEQTKIVTSHEAVGPLGMPEAHLTPTATGRRPVNSLYYAPVFRNVSNLAQKNKKPFLKLCLPATALFNKLNNGTAFLGPTAQRDLNKIVSKTESRELRGMPSTGLFASQNSGRFNMVPQQGIRKADWQSGGKSKNTNYNQSYWIGFNTKVMSAGKQNLLRDSVSTTGPYSGATSQHFRKPEMPMASAFSKQNKNSRIRSAFGRPQNNGVLADSMKKSTFIPFTPSFGYLQMANFKDRLVSSEEAKHSSYQPFQRADYKNWNATHLPMDNVLHISALKHLQSLRVSKKFFDKTHLRSASVHNTGSVLRQVGPHISQTGKRIRPQLRWGTVKKVPKHISNIAFTNRLGANHAASKANSNLVYKTRFAFSKLMSKSKDSLNDKILGSARGLVSAQPTVIANKWFINTNPRFLPNYDLRQNVIGSRNSTQTYVCIEIPGMIGAPFFLAGGLREQSQWNKAHNKQPCEHTNSCQSRLLIHKPTGKKVTNIESVFSTDAESKDSLFVQIKSLSQYFNAFTSRGQNMPKISTRTGLLRRGTQHLNCYYKHNKLNETILSLRKNISAYNTNLKLAGTNSLKHNWMSWYKVKTSIIFGKQASSANPISKLPNPTILVQEKLSKSTNLKQYFLTHSALVNKTQSGLGELGPRSAFGRPENHNMSDKRSQSLSPINLDDLRSKQKSVFFEKLAQKSWSNEPIFKLNYAGHASLIKQVYHARAYKSQSALGQQKVKTFFDLWKDGLTNYLLKQGLKQTPAKQIFRTENSFTNNFLEASEAGPSKTNMAPEATPEKQHIKSVLGKSILPFSKAAILGFYNQPCLAYSLVFKYKNYRLGFKPTFKLNSPLQRIGSLWSNSTLANLQDSKNISCAGGTPEKPGFKTEYNVSFDNLNTVVSALASTSFLSNYSGEVLGNINKSRYNSANSSLYSTTSKLYSNENILGTNNPIWYYTKQRIKQNQNRSLLLTTKDLVGYKITHFNNIKADARLGYAASYQNKFHIARSATCQSIFQHSNYKQLQYNWFKSLSSSALCSKYPTLLSKSQNLEQSNIDLEKTLSNQNILSEVGSFVLKGDYGVGITGKDFRLGPQQSLGIQNKYFTTSGQIIAINNQRFVLRKAQPIFISARTTFHYFHGDFVINNEPVVTLIYQKLKTGDIIQGIPKVEQFFEARTTKRGRLFRENLPNLLKGLFLKYYFNSFKFLKQAGPALKETNDLEASADKPQSVFGQKGKHGKPDSDNQRELKKRVKKTSKEVNQKNEKLVSTSKSSNNTHLAIQWAVKQSFYKIQQIAVDGVLRVYRSQGVSISDKHLEIIVKQMTTKVRIIRSGKSGLLPGELISLDFVQKLNTNLMGKVLYEPVILGITKASLQVDSFLSAASFQQTAKILSQAALINKKDFLKGVKENVIVGNLIPTGTGYLVSLF